MRTLLSVQTGGPETLVFRDDAPIPSPGPQEIRIRVRAAALNMPDLLMIEDKYQDRPERPFAPGSEVAGVVDAVGAEVTEFTPGQRVMAITNHGGLAEYACAHATKTSLIPDDMPFDHASALLVTYATAWYALKYRGDLKSSETLLVLGASGGVGLAAIELGKALGARVLAGVSSAEKLAVAREAGADDGLIYPTEEMSAEERKALSQAFKKLGGDAGIDAIFDPIGGQYVEPAFRAIGWGGRHLVIGFVTGIAALPMNLPLLKGAGVIGVYWADSLIREPAGHRTAVAELCALYSQGLIRPRIQSRFALEDGAMAMELLGSRRATGKIVVEI